MKFNMVLGYRLLIINVNTCTQIYAVAYRISDTFSEFTVRGGREAVTSPLTPHFAKRGRLMLQLLLLFLLLLLLLSLLLLL